jgi:hypothetical protein
MSVVQLLSAATATNSAPVATATGSITTVAVADLLDTETFTIRDKNRVFTFELDVNGTGVTSGNVQVNVSTDTTSDHVRDRIVTAINASECDVTAASGGSATVSITSDTFGPDGNLVMTETVANGTFAVSTTDATAGALLKSSSSRAYGLAGASTAHLLVASTAGSATMTATIKLWGVFRISGTLAYWAPLGTHATAATKGIINEGNALGETGTDSIRHAEVIDLIEGIERVYAEITAIGGTNTAISAWLVGIGE